jgi:uncharacterized protein
MNSQPDKQPPLLQPLIKTDNIISDSRCIMQQFQNKERAAMTNYKDISIDDKQLFDSYFSAKGYDISEFTFTNLYMWRKAFRIQYLEQNGFLCITALSEDSSPFFFMPVGSGNLGEVLDRLTARPVGYQCPVLRSLSGKMMEEIEAARPGMFVFEPEPSLFDYVYLSSDLVDLKGKKYHAKRNHIHKFHSLYEYSYDSYNSSWRDACARALEAWYERNGSSTDPVLALERNAIWDILDNHETLQYKGGILTVEGCIVAMAFGERLNSETAVIHVEKANTDYEGAYAMINQKFCEQEWKGMLYINREEDMGIEGLRKAKRSYHPERMVEKFNAYVR